LQASALAFDATDYEAVATAVAASAPVDILVNNAGVPGREGMQLEAFEETSPANWRALVDVNLYGTLNCSHAVLPSMRE
jgi:NADP-dependent 3-hydroxy acid dehydrogenase YdfG